ncbi:unnamed protein product, partial [Chrysoparadoxa australica]
AADKDARITEAFTQLRRSLIHLQHMEKKIWGATDHLLPVTLALQIGRSCHYASEVFAVFVKLGARVTLNE